MQVLEGALRVLFYITLALVAIGAVIQPQYFPQGGVGLIIIGILMAIVHTIRNPLD